MERVYYYLTLYTEFFLKRRVANPKYIKKEKRDTRRSETLPKPPFHKSKVESINVIAIPNG
jgi:hypothetical protein